MQHERNHFEQEMNRLAEVEENRQAKLLLDKMEASGNKLMVGMLLEKSRDVYDFSLFDPEGKSAEKRDAEKKAADNSDENEDVQKDDAEKKEMNTNSLAAALE